MSTDPPDLDPAALDRLREWGGPSLLSQMIRLFLDNSPERLEQIRAAAGEGTAATAERGAHSLKSSAANVGATALSQIAARVEDVAACGDLAAVEGLRPDIEAAYERARQGLEGFLESMDETP